MKLHNRTHENYEHDSHSCRIYHSHSRGSGHLDGLRRGDQSSVGSSKEENRFAIRKHHDCDFGVYVGQRWGRFNCGRILLDSGQAAFIQLNSQSGNFHGGRLSRVCRLFLVTKSPGTWPMVTYFQYQEIPGDVWERDCHTFYYWIQFESNNSNSRNQQPRRKLAGYESECILGWRVLDAEFLISQFATSNLEQWVLGWGWGFSQISISTD